MKDFSSQFSSLQADNARLQEDVLSKSSHLDQGVKIAATARQDVDSLRKELGQLRRKLKKEEKEKDDAQTQNKEREDLLHKSAKALLGNVVVFSLNFFYSSRILTSARTFFCRSCRYISSNSIGKLPAGSSADAISLAIGSSDLVQALLQKNKAVLSWLHAMIFPKVDQLKTLEQLADTFSVNTEGIIEVFKRTSRTYGALLDFHLLMA
jgi:hypothetical protein